MVKELYWPAHSENSQLVFELATLSGFEAREFYNTWKPARDRVNKVEKVCS